MECFYGFDLGDAESAIACLKKGEESSPQLIGVGSSKSFITAYAQVGRGDDGSDTLLIGEQACYEASAFRRKLRFKSRFLTDKSSHADIRRFAEGVLEHLYRSGALKAEEDQCFYIGCPAGWDKDSREQYRALFERAGYPPVRIISESRAAMISACQSKHLQVGYDILSRPVLVADIGSSTTDFAYIVGGREVEMRAAGEMKTGGEVRLGGGIMDEMLLEMAVQESPDRSAIEQVFSESEPWKNYCEFAARRLKERYFSDPEYFQDHECRETIRIHLKKPLKLTLRIDEQIADRLQNDPAPGLDGKSFRQVFTQALQNIREETAERLPELLFLTGGVSKMPMIRDWCREQFPESIVISGTEPEFAVARGLAWSGKIDEQLKGFRRELETLKASRTVEDIVSSHMNELYHAVVDALVEPLLVNAAVPVFSRWREGEIRRLSDTNVELEKEIEAFLKTETARSLMVRPVASWLKVVADELEEYTVPLCVRHDVPYTALSLKSYLPLTQIDVKIDARNVFALEEITWMIDSIISVIVGLLCGGSGVALISGGPVGIIAGALISLLVLFLGKGKMEEALLSVDLPRPMRKLVPKHSLEGRMDTIAASVRKNLFDSLEKEQNDEITDRMTEEVSAQIEACLTRMAEVVEIPLG